MLCLDQDLMQRCACMQGRPSGRLLSYNPVTRKTHVVAQGFWFANGVTLSKDESFVALVETNTQSVHRIWLSGPKVRPLASILPGQNTLTPPLLQNIQSVSHHALRQTCPASSYIQ